MPISNGANFTGLLDYDAMILITLYYCEDRLCNFTSSSL